MKENPLQYRVRGTPVPTTQTRGTNYPKSTVGTYLTAESSKTNFRTLPQGENASPRYRLTINTTEPL